MIVVPVVKNIEHFALSIFAEVHACKMSFPAI